MNDSTPNEAPKEGFGKLMSELVRKTVEEQVNRLVAAEFDALMGYGKSQRAPEGQTDRRNGSYQREFATEYGPITVTMPRSREAAFESRAMPKYRRGSEALASAVIRLYRAGATLSEISEVIEAIYGASYSPSTVSRIIRSVEADAKAFNSTELPERVFALFLDGTYLPLKRGTVERECLMMACAITEDGERRILGFTVAPSESATAYRELLTQLSERGLRRPEFVVSDGLCGLGDAIRECFPKAKVQRCLIHLMRNVGSKVRPSDRKEVCGDFMKVADKADRAEAEAEFDAFVSKWSKKYKRIGEWAGKAKDMLTFYDADPSLRRLIYTSNAIESVNHLFKREMAKTAQFACEESLDRRLLTIIERYNSRGRRCRAFADVIAYMDRKE